MPNYLIWTLAAKRRQEGSGQNNQKTFHRSFYPPSMAFHWTLKKAFVPQDLFALTNFSSNSNKLLTEGSQAQLIQKEKCLLLCTDNLCVVSYLSVCSTNLKATTIT